MVNLDVILGSKQATVTKCTMIIGLIIGKGVEGEGEFKAQFRIKKIKC